MKMAAPPYRGLPPEVRPRLQQLREQEEQGGMSRSGRRIVVTSVQAASCPSGGGRSYDIFVFAAVAARS